MKGGHNVLARDHSMIPNQSPRTGSMSCWFTKKFDRSSNGSVKAYLQGWLGLGTIRLCRVHLGVSKKQGLKNKTQKSRAVTALKDTQEMDPQFVERAM